MTDSLFDESVNKSYFCFAKATRGLLLTVVAIHVVNNGVVLTDGA